MRTHCKLLVAPLILTIAVIALYVFSSTPSKTLFDKASEILPPKQAGFGLNPSQSVYRHYPMAYALYASAQAIHFTKTSDKSAIRNAKIAADWLVNNADCNSDGIPGWGLPFSWDAFQDGSTNPPHTVYGITTAIAVHALLDVYQLTKESKYLEATISSLNAYLPHFQSIGECGYFSYSEKSEDAKPVLNITSMLAGAYARAGEVSENDKFRNVAVKAARFVCDNTIEDENGYHWLYKVGRKDKVNDTVHAAYMVKGLMDVKECIGLEYDLSKSYEYLAHFVTPEKVVRFVGSERPARSWGVGYLMYVLCCAGQHEEAKKILPMLKAYEYETGRYGHFPGDTEMFPRYQTHILIGLAECKF
jgi:hypothetical protein